MLKFQQNIDVTGHRSPLLILTDLLFSDKYYMHIYLGPLEI